MGIEGFPNITRTAQPEGYDDLIFTLTVNLSGADFNVLLRGHEPEDTSGRSAFGAVLAAVYNHERIEWRGHTFDFTDGDAALATLESLALPLDLRFWIRNAPVEAADVYLENLRKNFRRSFESTSN